MRFGTFLVACAGCLALGNLCFAQDGPVPESPPRSDPARTEGDPVSHPKHENRLIHETSPYLRQHAHNPVDWYAWGPEAIETARRQDKPIFLSIGYSACHWCHVMEHESFENEEIAKVMNENFICIKVDREERPDLDEIYMAAVQMISGSGGWPMSVWLTPDLEPFYGGTYFPPENRWGKPGFKTVLQRLSESWKEQRGEIDKSAKYLTEALAGAGAVPGDAGEVGVDLLDRACTALENSFDSELGGHGGAPKFPPSMELNLMMRRASKTKQGKLLELVETTLDHMARGGMYDQIGGGFCRYSTDEHWLVPHFEKMLYDNALLSRTYLAAFQLTGKAFYARIARETLDYVLRDMSRPGGGYYSSEDADSEGVEGKFYVWSKPEILALLGPEEGELFCNFYDITEHGNWEETNIPNVPVPLETFAASRQEAPEKLQARLESARAKVLAARARRVRPGLDDKLLTAWNALMIQSMVMGHQVLGEARYRNSAIETARFLLDQMRRDGRLLVTWKDGSAKLNAYLDDHAFLAAALLDVYEDTFDPTWLDQAKSLTEDTLRRFWDDAEGGLFFTSHDHEKLIARTKAPYDGVIPSGNSECARNLVRLSLLTGDEKLRERALKILRLFRGGMHASPRGFANMLCVLDLHLSAPREIALVGRRDDPALLDLLWTIHRSYVPDRVLALLDPSQTDAAAVGELIPLLRDKTLVDGKPAAFVCRNFTCKKPATTTDELRAMLRD